MASTDATIVDGLYTDAVNPDHPYHSDLQMALSFLSSVTNALGSECITTDSSLKMVIAYIHIECSINEGASAHINLMI